MRLRRAALWRLKHYIVRIWRRSDAEDSRVLGVVEELSEERDEYCEEIEEFVKNLRARRTRPPQRKRSFSSFEELRRILGSS